MKIAYVVHGYTNSAGMERVLSTKANYLVEQGHSVFIVSLRNDSKEPFFFFDPRIEILKLGVSDDTEKYKEEFLSKLSECLIAIKPDISISTGLGITKYLFEVQDGSKKILELHFTKYKRKFELAALDNYALGRLITKIYSYKKIQLAKKYDRFVVLTEEDKESWGELSNILVIPNPVSFVPSDYSNNGAKKVIAVGRYTYQKGFDLLIDLWGEVYKKHPNWSLSLYGAGKKKKELESKIEKLKLDGSITLNEPTKNISSKLIESSIFVMTSRYEGQGLALIEAMACGLPSVAFACKCGPRDIIKEGEDGFLIDMGDSSKFVAQLTKLIEDDNLRRQMGHNATKNVQRFSEDVIMNKWTSLFEDLLK